jgi:hypothetical protein
MSEPLPGVARKIGTALAERLAERLAAASDRLRKETAAKTPTERIGVLAIMKNEALNILEWVDHYRWQGVSRIFLIDNGSDDHGKRLIEADIDAGFIEYFWRPQKHQQAAHYREIYAAAAVRDKVDWLVIADLDEFWYSPLGNLGLALDLLEPDADLVYSNWLVFGSGGRVDHPASLRRELTLRHPALSRHCNSKWICRTRSILAARAIDVHKVRWVDSRRVVSENDLLRLNHYVTQSAHYFKTVKMTRGDVSNAKMDDVRTWEYFDSYDAEATVRDEVLAGMVAASKSST